MDNLYLTQYNLIKYKTKGDHNMSIYDFTVPTPKGEEISLKDYEGKVILIVNTATGCGFTPHYKPIEQMYEDLHDKGLEIIDVPCNQFAGQTPGTDDEIHEFCTVHYNTTFPQMKKADVNGANELPLYTWLKEQLPDEEVHGVKAKAAMAMIKTISSTCKEKGDIKWNFTKFLVDREGNAVRRYAPTTDPDQIEKDIQALL